MMNIQIWIRRCVALVVMITVFSGVCLAQRDPGRYSNAVDWGAWSDSMEPLVIVGAVVLGLGVAGLVFKAAARQPLLSFVPAKLDFGTVAAGETATRPIVLVNKSSRDVRIDPIAVSGASFSLAKAWEGPLVLAKGQQASIEISFAPAGLAKYSGLLKATIQERGRKKAREVRAKMSGSVLGIQ
jgi:hypothetical protein